MEDVLSSSAKPIGRRAFLAGASMAGLAALAGCAKQEQEAPTEGAEPASEQAEAPVQAPEEDIYQGICRGNCGGGCIMNVHVREGKIVKTSAIHQPDEDDTRICQRGLSQVLNVYSPERLQYPMRRAEGTERGAGEWERISWDEAIQQIADKMSEVAATYGPQCNAFTYGAGTYAYNYYVYMRLANLIGASQVVPEYDMGALETGWAMYGMSTYLIGNNNNDVSNAKYIFTWAHNGTLSAMMRWRYILKARRNGAKHIVIDPVYTDTAEKADMWVPIKPGTDGALAMGMINVCLEEGLTDDVALRDKTVAPFLVKRDTNCTFLRASDLGVEPTEGPINPYTGQPTVIDPIVVMGADGTAGILGEEVTEPEIHGTFEVNGIQVTTALDMLAERVAEWTPEHTEEVTEVPADTVRELARMYAEGPTTLEIGFGNDHWGNSESVTLGQLTLPLITGQFGKKGAGVGGTQGQSSSGWAEANVAGLVFPEGAVGGLTMPMNYFPEVQETGMFGEIPMTIKCLFNAAGNPLGSHPDRGALLKALEGVELFVVADSRMTDTVRYADIVLPTPYWFEFETVSTCPGKYVDLNEQAIEPLYETQDDIEICALIGQAMGYDQMNITHDEYYETLMSSEAVQAKGISLQALREQKRMLAFPEEWLYGSDEAPFITATGRGQFFLENAMAGFPMSGKTVDPVKYSMCHYDEPLEAYESNPLRETYPITMITHRDRFKVHTAWAKNPIMNELEPEPTIQINPTDASERGIVDGDIVRVFNDRGEVKMRAWLDAAMRPGMIWTEHTWLDDQYVDGHYSLLTSIATRDFHPAVHPFDTLVQIEKA
ncbi:molybdopterin-containing oxidoreductase family protein [Slackia heliotrinireducens]|uniref:molybdopterin-containing oxidoreductase family protein n=1 Tax=Slackia heliotrinireducens TaxID=84110 RepID=UPI00331462BC